MIKAFVLFLFLGTITNTNWTLVRINEKVTIKLPDNYMKIDTLGLLMYAGTTESSFLVLSISQKNTLYTYGNSKELIHSFDIMFDGLLSTFKDSILLSKKNYKLDDLNGRKIEFRYEKEGKIIHCISVYFVVDETPYNLMVQSEKRVDCSADFKQIATSIKCKI